MEIKDHRNTDKGQKEKLLLPLFLLLNGWFKGFSGSKGEREERERGKKEENNFSFFPIPTNLPLSQFKP